MTFYVTFTSLQGEKEDSLAIALNALKNGGFVYYDKQEQIVGINCVLGPDSDAR